MMEISCHINPHQSSPSRNGSDLQPSENADEIPWPQTPLGLPNRSDSDHPDKQTRVTARLDAFLLAAREHPRSLALSLELARPKLRERTQPRPDSTSKSRERTQSGSGPTPKSRERTQSGSAYPSLESRERTHWQSVSNLRPHAARSPARKLRWRNDETKPLAIWRAYSQNIVCLLCADYDDPAVNRHRVDRRRFLIDPGAKKSAPSP
jgi:hypothetical protein